MSPRLAAAAVLAACAACGPRPVTYATDVAPLLQERCTSCHREGGIAPFALETYEQAVEQAAAVKAATQSRIMPPWGVDGSGNCQKWADSEWLTDAQLDVLAQWAEGAHPRGAAVAPSPRQAPPFSPTHTADPGVDYALRSDISDDYRCFLVDPGSLKIASSPRTASTPAMRASCTT
jgi:hypothetical protein